MANLLFSFHVTSLTSHFLICLCDAKDKVVQTIHYSNKKLEKARKYKMRWVMEFPDKWLAYDKVPTDLRDMFKTRNRERRDVQKKLNASSNKVSDSSIFKIQQNEV